MNFIWPVVFCALIVCGNTQPDFQEPCPSDSVQIEDVCKCDYTLCDKPPCATTLVQLTNLTNNPGECCPTYSCEGCNKEEEIEGLCPCLPGAILRSGRSCECANYHDTIVNDTCECDGDKCALPDLCDRGSVAVKEFDGCCEKIKCVQCPEDSYSTSYNDFLIEDKCVCFPCAPIKCNENQSLRILRKGKNVPGTCCDFYSCNNGCLVNGTMYPDGDAWSSGDSKCKCLNGISHCSPVDGNKLYKSCLSGDKVYHHLETWIEDSCTNCTCENGNSKCIAHMCDIHVSEVKPPSTLECPSMTSCKKACDNGFKLNKQGCEICKCRMQNKSYKIEALLMDYNLTEDDVVTVVKKYLETEQSKSSSTSSTSTTTTTTTTTTSTTAAPSTTICITQNKNVRGDCTYSCILEYAIPGFVVGAIFAAILLFTFLKCSEKNRQKYKMHYNYKPVGKEGLDKNLNISPIINSKNFELKSYNEKKNVI